MSEEVSQIAAALRSAQRLVVKTGSALVCGGDGSVRADWMASVAADIAGLRARGCEVVLVSSGAVALGRRKLELDGVLRLEEKQAASAAGQAALTQAWQEAFHAHGVSVAQILLTLDDTEHRRRYLNARATFTTLLELGALPLVNENDTVATSEIRYGDNDRLAAHVAQLLRADLLFILSDIDGLYTADPRKDADAQHLARVEAITPEIEAMAGGANALASMGSGGMASKVAAAKIAYSAGCATLIARGLDEHPIDAVANGARATLFAPSASPERARRQWIGGRQKAAGAVHVDAGAANAILGGASLLPAGIVKIAGAFNKGDAVTLVAPSGRIIAQGLSTYDSGDLDRVAGKRSSEIELVLGYRRRPAVVERDDMVLTLESET